MEKVPGDDPVRSELRYHANAMVARSADARGSDYVCVESLAKSTLFATSAHVSRPTLLEASSGVSEVRTALTR